MFRYRSGWPSVDFNSIRSLEQRFGSESVGSQHQTGRFAAPIPKPPHLSPPLPLPLPPDPQNLFFILVNGVLPVLEDLILDSNSVPQTLCLLRPRLPLHEQPL